VSERPSAARFWRLAPWCVVIVHVACGLSVSLLWFPLGDIGVESDFFGELGPAAQAIARGEISVLHHPYKGPLHGFVLTAVHAVLQPLAVGWYRAAVMVSLLSTAVALLLVNHLVGTVAGRRAGLAALLLTGAVYEVFIQSHKASSDPLFLLLVLATVAAVFTPDRAGARRWLLAGLLAAAAMLTRYIGAVLLVWLLWQAATGGGSPVRRGRCAGLALAGWLLVVGPWLGLSLSETGSLLHSRNLENVARAFAPVLGTEAAWSASSLPALVAQDPGRVLGHYALRILDTVRLDAKHLLGWPLAVVALLGVPRVRDPRAGRWLLAGGLYLLAVAWVFYLPRFNLPLVPLYALLAATALFLPAPAAAPRWQRRLVAVWAWRGWLPAWLVVAGLVVFHGQQGALAVRHYHQEQPLHLQGAVAHLEGVAARWPGPSRPALLARTPHVAFYAGCDHRPYPRRRLDAAAFLAHASDQAADLVLVGPVERRLAPELAFLDDLAGYAGLAPIFSDGVNTVLAVDRDHPDLGLDLVATALADSVAASLARADLDAALQPGHDLMQRHLRAGRLPAARTVVDDLLAHAQSRPDRDRDLIRRLRLDLDWIAAQLAAPEGPQP
jgi:hypothetical protein